MANVDGVVSSEIQSDFHVQWLTINKIRDQFFSIGKRYG